MASNKKGKRNATSAFSAMVRAGDLEIDIVAPKYAKMQKQLVNMRRVLEVLVNLYSGVFPDINCWEDIRNFMAGIQLIDWVKDEVKHGIVDERPAANETAMLAHYSRMKESQEVRNCIVMIERILPYKEYLTPVAPERLVDYPSGYNDTFIAQIPGISFSPFPFAESFNLKVLWADPRTTSPIKKNIVATLKAILDMSERVYNICMTPDADSGKMISSITESLQNLRTQPQFSRMKHAFQILDNSVDMLERNFPTYYKRSVHARNENVIIEDYINDVVNGENVSEAAKREFGQMIRIISKDIAKRAANPNERQLIEKLSGVATSAFGAGDGGSDSKED